jgi:hypothetical protein
MTACEAPSTVTVFFDLARSAINASSGNAVVARCKDEQGSRSPLRRRLLPIADLIEQPSVDG